MPFLRYFFLTFFMICLLVVGWAGFRGSKTTRPPIIVFPDMDDQPKLKFQTSSDFFADGGGARKPLPGTIPMGLAVPAATGAETDKGATLGFTVGTDYYHTGRFGDYWGDGMPEQVAVDHALIRRGGERYAIYCTPCHGLSGDGQGITAKYGIPTAAGNFHLPPLADPKDPTFRTDGNIFHTITYGKGQMGPYGAMIPVQDRWAIIAYVRTLQLAKQSATATSAAAPAPAGTPPPTPATTPPAAPAATPPAPTAPPPTPATPPVPSGQAPPAGQTPPGPTAPPPAPPAQPPTAQPPAASASAPLQTGGLRHSGPQACGTSTADFPVCRVADFQSAAHNRDAGVSPVRTSGIWPDFGFDLVMTGQDGRVTRRQDVSVTSSH